MEYELFFINIPQKIFLEQMFFGISLLVLFLGQRTYRILLFLPSFILGISLIQSHFSSFSTIVRLGVVLGIGVLGVGLVMAIEQFMIALVGAFLGGGCVHYLGWDLYWWLQHFGDIEFTVQSLELQPPKHPPQQNTMPWYYTSVGAFLGAFLFSKFFERYLPVTTSFCGSLMLCWSLGFRDVMHYHVFFLLWLLGATVQYRYQPVHNTKNAS